MKQNRVLIIGNSGIKHKSTDGQTIKVRFYIDALKKECVPFDFVDLEGGIKNIFKISRQIKKGIKKCDRIILLTASRGVKYFIPLINHFNKEHKVFILPMIGCNILNKYFKSVSIDEYFDYFNLKKEFKLKKKDIDSVVKTEFENACYEKEVNQDIYQTKYILTKSESSEKLKAINMAIPKTFIAQKKNQIGETKVKYILPLSATLPNIVNQGKTSGSTIIVNIEKNTTITKVSQNSILDIQVLPYGSQEILNNINVNEHTEEKQGLTYLSWAWAWAEVLKRYPDAQYHIERFGEDQKPYLFDDKLGYMVFTRVEIDGIEKEMWLPVMDSNNKAMLDHEYTYQGQIQYDNDYIPLMAHLFHNR